MRSLPFVDETKVPPAFIYNIAVFFKPLIGISPHTHTHQLSRMAGRQRPTNLAQNFIEAKHRHSILSSAFGLQFAVQHALDHARHVWETERTTSPVSWTRFEDFVQASYYDLREEDHRPHSLPANSIPFYAWGSFSLDAYTFIARSASWWYMLDMIAPNPAYIIPSTLFVPYARISPARSVNVVQSFKRSTLWFIRQDGDLGVPVQGDRPMLWHGQKNFSRYDGQWRTTMKIKLSVRRCTTYRSRLTQILRSVAWIW